MVELTEDEYEALKEAAQRGIKALEEDADRRWKIGLQIIAAETYEKAIMAQAALRKLCGG